MSSSRIYRLGRINSVSGWALIPGIRFSFWFFLQHGLQVCKRVVRCQCLLSVCAFASFLFQHAIMFVVVAVQAEQFPVAAVRRVVVVVVVFVMDGQFAQVHAGKAAPAAPAYPREEFEGAFAVA